MIDATKLTDEELMHIELALNLYISHLHEDAYLTECKPYKCEIYDPAKQEGYKARAQALAGLEKSIKKAIEIYSPILAEYSKRWGGAKMTESELKELEEIKKQVIEDARAKRLKCSQVCATWDKDAHDCEIYGSQHPSPSRCPYYYDCEANIIYWSKRKGVKK